MHLFIGQDYFHDFLWSGSAAVSKDCRIYAFTNLLNGIEIFSLPGLKHCGTIAQAIQAEFNVTLGIAFNGVDHLVVGEYGGVCMYEVSTRTLLYRLQGLAAQGMSAYFRTRAALIAIVKIFIGLFRCAQ